MVIIIILFYFVIVNVLETSHDSILFNLFKVVQISKIAYEVCVSPLALQMRERCRVTLNCSRSHLINGRTKALPAPAHISFNLQEQRETQPQTRVWPGGLTCMESTRLSGVSVMRIFPPTL